MVKVRNGISVGTAKVPCEVWSYFGLIEAPQYSAQYNYRLLTKQYWLDMLYRIEKHFALLTIEVNDA